MNKDRAKFQPLATLSGFINVSHPFPASMNAIAAAIFYVLLADRISFGNLALLFFSVLLVHASIGSANDVLDISLDQQTRSDKPIVRGDIASRTAVLFSFIAAATSLLLAGFLGLGSLLVALAVLASGMAYNFWAKGTIYSWLPYAVAIPAIPVWSFLAADKFAGIVLLSFPLGALISLALNLANTVPDLSGDVLYGIKGLTHRLGQKRSIIVIWCSFAAAIVLLALTPPILGNNASRLIPGISSGAILLFGMIVDYSRSRSTKRMWYLSAILSIVLGVAWVASIS